MIFSFSTLGLVAGTLSGFSRTSILGTVLPAVLSLVAGLGIYIIGKDSTDLRTGSRALTASSILSLSLSLFLGSGCGAVLRQATEDYRQSSEFRMQRAWDELKVREFRQELGLSPDEPTAPPTNAIIESTSSRNTKTNLPPK